MFEEASIYKPGLKKAFVINSKIANTAIGRDVVEALSDYPIPVLDHAICQRVPFAESATQGLTVFELDSDMLASRGDDGADRQDSGGVAMKKVSFRGKRPTAQDVSADDWVSFRQTEQKEVMKRLTIR